MISAANSAAIPCLPYAAAGLAVGLADALAVGLADVVAVGPAGAAAAGAAAAVPELLAGVVAAVAVPVVLAGVVAAVAAACVSRPSSSLWRCPCPSWPREPPAWRSAANKSCKNACKSAPSEFAEVPLELDEAGLDEVELEEVELVVPVLDVPAAVVVIGVETAVAGEVALDALVIAAAAAEFWVTN